MEIFVYAMSALSADYKNPRKTEISKYKSERNLATDQEVINHLNTWGGDYFIGTQDEYDKLKTVVEVYYNIASKGNNTLTFVGIDNLVDGKVVNKFEDSPEWLTTARWQEVNVVNSIHYALNDATHVVTWMWLDYLIGNKNGVAPTLNDLVTDTNAIEITESQVTEYMIPQTIYYDLNGQTGIVTWVWASYLNKDGSKATAPKLDELVGRAKELTKTEYDNLNILRNKVSNLILISSPKLAAYIVKCEDYISEHVNDLKAPQLKAFMLPNGKIDDTALETTIKNNQNKSDSIALLCEAYLSWIVLIEKGTQAGLDELPETDPTKLNAIIDTLWKAEHDKERKALIAKLNSSEAEFAIVDKYLVVNQGDEPEIK